MRKKVVVTGGARGIGKSIVWEFAKNGYDVIINYNKSKEQAINLKKQVEQEFNVKAYTYKCDVSKEDEVKRLFDDIWTEVGEIDCLVNNAAIALDNNLGDKDSKEFMKVLEVNLLGTFLMSKYVRKVMNNGVITNITSTNGIDTTYIESIDYDASKAGVISLTHNFANYYKPNIRVNAIAPGWVNTDMNKNLNPKFKNEEENKILLGHFAECEDVAKVVYFVSSDNGSYINNEVIRVDGGLKC